MQLIVISHPDNVANEARLINQLFENGLTRFHLRKPGYDEEQIVRLLEQIDERYHHYIALHQHHGMAQDFGIERLHYTEQNRASISADKLALLIDEGYILSTSVHDLEALYTLKYFDNAFFGPIFNSISKPGYQAKWPDSFSLNKQDIQVNITALGGINLSNLSRVKAMNFDGVAVLGTIWNNPDLAISNFKNLKQGLPS
jgi:thiamine-phosphate pyrophosphorylase